MNTKLVTKEGLFAILDRIKTEAERDATLEGTFSYRAEGKGMFEVHGFVRTGNDMGQGGALVIQGEPVYVTGWTKEHRFVRIEGDPYGGPKRDEARIFIDDELIDRRDAQMNRYRDGGTTDIRTPKGNIHVPSKFKVQAAEERGEQLWPTLDGEPLEPMEPMG